MTAEPPPVRGDANPPAVSVVIPAYNEANRITSTLNRLIEVGPRLGILEVIVVDDGSSDTTAELVAARASEGAPTIRLVQLAENRGKGAAVRAGVAVAVGRYVAFLDADLSAPPDPIPQAVAAIEAGADIAIGSRAGRDGVDRRSSQPFMRRLSGRVFTQLQRRIVGLPYADTQCPFKVFSRDAAHAVYPLVQTSGWAFDVELLARARRFGLTIEEFEVEWQHVGGSHIRVGPLAALQVVRELVSIRSRVGRAP